MPLTSRAIKKLAHDKERAKTNLAVKRGVQKLVHDLRRKPTTKTLTLVYRALDKAAKVKVIHPNKASRLKSRLAKLLKKHFHPSPKPNAIP